MTNEEREREREEVYVTAGDVMMTLAPGRDIPRGL